MSGSPDGHRGRLGGYFIWFGWNCFGGKIANVISIRKSYATGLINKK